MQASRMLRPFVSIRFQVLFHSPLGVLFTFPSRYLFTIGHQRVFSLTRWFWQIPTDFHSFRGTWDTLVRESCAFSPTGLSPSMVALSKHSTNNMIFELFDLLQFSPQAPHNTADTTVAAFNISDGLDCFPFARRYLGNRYLLSLPQGTEIFHFPWLTLRTYEFSMEYPALPDGLPHSETPGLKVVIHLPEAYRR